MPELPEVEVTRRQLEPLLVGRRVTEVLTTRPSYFFLTPPATLRRRLVGRKFVSLSRRGKYIVATLDGGERLLLHLGMTGQIFGAGVSSIRLLASTAGAALTPEAQRAAFRPDAHTHLQLRFADAGPDVFFRDTRKFGKVQVLAADEASPRLARLGVDALEARARDLWAPSRRRTVAIKALLLDQSVIAGVGNIYADEALFRAGVAPLRPAYQLSRADCARLVAAIKGVLRRAIASGGSSISDYVQPGGEDGRYQDESQVYGREGEPCRRCGRVVRRVVIGGRSSHHCPRCQR
jgi:formamidopyrimidine-DNA glycosylase